MLVTASMLDDMVPDVTETQICQIAKMQITKLSAPGEPLFKVSARYLINVGLLQASIDTGPSLMIE
jgi:hypothetical protein